MSTKNKPNLNTISKIYKGDKKKITIILKKYIENISSQIKDIEIYFEKEDFNQVKNIIHTMKTSLYYLGLENMREMIINIEKKIDNQDNTPDLSILIKYLYSEWSEIKKNIEILIQDLET